MSALRQKRTSLDVRATSALPPKADIHCGSQNVCFGPMEVGSLLDHLVSGHLQRQRQVEAEGLGRLEVDDEFEFRRLLHR
jgi:hypothetical protein